MNEKLNLELIKHREKIEKLKNNIYEVIIDKEFYYIHLAMNEMIKELGELYNLSEIKK